MLEDKMIKLEEPKTMGECWKVFEKFGLVLPSNLDYTFENAIQLVKINNEFLSLIDKYKEALTQCRANAKFLQHVPEIGRIYTLADNALEKE